MLDDHIRYLERRIAGFAPASIHGRQIEAYRAALEAARAATGEREYLEQTADLVALTRGEWIDRYEAAAAVYEALGDPGAAAIARANAAAAEGAADHESLLAAIINARQTGAGDAEQVPTLVAALLEHRVDPNAARREDLERIWQVFSGRPRLGASRLRRRLPFADAGVARLDAWLDELGLPDNGPPPAPPALALEAPAATSAAPTAAAIAASYRAAGHESLRQVHDRIDALAAGATSGMALLAAMAAEDLFAALAREPLMAAARQARGELAADSAAAAHHDRLIAALEAARSVAEIELCQRAADELLSIESAWARVLFAAALRPCVAALADAVESSEASRRRLAETEAIAVALFGAGTETLLSAPAIWRVFERELFDRGQDLSPPVEGSDPQARHGELVLDVAPRTRAVLIERAIAAAGADGEALVQMLAGRQFASPEALRELVLERIAGSGAPAGSAAWPLILHGQAVELEGLAAALLDPPRPALAVPC